MFPLGVRSKFPAISKELGGRGFYDATTDEVQIRKWWTENPNFNIGIRTGKISNLFVLDVDEDPAEGKYGYRSLAKSRKKWDTVETLLVKTGGGGEHWFFTFPENSGLTQGVEFDSGLDFRNETGYIVAPGSIHPETGEAYAFANDLPLATVPQALLDQIWEHKNEKKSTPVKKKPKEGEVVSRSFSATKGGRNSHITQRAGFFKQQGVLSYDVLWATNIADCDPPLDEAEVRKIFLSVDRYEEGEVDEATVTSLGFEFLDHLKAQGTRLVVWHDRWYQDCLGHFAQLPQSDVVAMLVRFLQQHPAFRQAITGRLTSDILLNAGANCRVSGLFNPPCFLSDPKRDTRRLIAVNNGLLDVRDYCENGGAVHLLPHSADYFNLACLPFEYDVEARCPNWEAFLERVQPDPAARQLIREWFAYNLIPETELSRFMLFKGEGANGKSVCCTVLKELLGEKNVSAVSLEAFDSTRTFNLAALQGKLANIVEDMNELESTQEGLLKTLVSGGCITVEEKYGHPFLMRSHARITLSTNVLPKFKDSSNGLWRRMLYLPFDITIPIDQQDARYLLPSFWQKELPGIFNWALESLPALLQVGRFVEPKVAVMAKEEYRAETNSARLFLTTQCSSKEGAAVARRSLYDKYEAFCEAEKLGRPFGPRKFSQEVQRLFPSAAASSGTAVIRLSSGGRDRVWHGIELVDVVLEARLSHIEKSI